MGLQKYKIECTMVAVIEAKERPYAIANEVLAQDVTINRVRIEQETPTKGIAGCRLCTSQG